MMERCDCGTKISRWSVFPVCADCLRGYLNELPRRSGYTLSDFVFERQQLRQAAATQTIVSVMPQRIRLLDTLIDPLTLKDAMAEIERFVAAGQPRQLVTVNVDFVRIAQDNDQFRRVVNNSDL